MFSFFGQIETDADKLFAPVRESLSVLTERRADERWERMLQRIRWFVWNLFSLQKCSFNVGSPCNTKIACASLKIQEGTVRPTDLAMLGVASNVSVPRGSCTQLLLVLKKVKWSRILDVWYCPLLISAGRCMIRLWFPALWYVGAPSENIRMVRSSGLESAKKLNRNEVAAFTVDWQWGRQTCSINLEV